MALAFALNTGDGADGVYFLSPGTSGGPADSRGLFRPHCCRGGWIASSGKRYPGPVRPAGTSG